MEAGSDNLVHMVPTSELITQHLSVLQFLVQSQSITRGNDEDPSSRKRLSGQLTFFYDGSWSESFREADIQMSKTKSDSFTIFQRWARLDF